MYSMGYAFKDSLICSYDKEIPVPLQDRELTSNGSYTRREVRHLYRARK